MATTERSGLQAPRVVVFDVNGTLSDLAPMAERFTDVGLPGHLTPTWFASALRDGFALAAVGTSATFSAIAADLLRGLVTQQAPGRHAGVDWQGRKAVDHVLDGGLAVPPPEPYAYAADKCQVSPAEMLLVAAHLWDIDGAARAGLRTAWVDRTGTASSPSYLTHPGLIVCGIDDLIQKLAR